MLAVFRKPKTFKLRAVHSQEKFGVAGRSCQEVLQKGCLHLQVPGAGWDVGRTGWRPVQVPVARVRGPGASSHFFLWFPSPIRREFAEGFWGNTSPF